MTLDATWTDIDGWWDAYGWDQEADLVELRGLLDRLEGRWRESEVIFGRDPLSADWSERSPQAGPLRTNQEENWSQWLAHLIRTGSEAFAEELFGPGFDETPVAVRTEKVLHDEKLHDRRADVIVEFTDRGVSIEVKIGDEHYGKTPQTAYLTEVHYPRELDWTHWLLLPASKAAALADEFGSRIEEVRAESRMIRTEHDQEKPVTIRHWQSVSQALRRTLLSNTDLDDHWAASAFLLATIIEQQLLNFHPMARLEDYGGASLGVSDINRLQAIDPEDQLEYLNQAFGYHDE